MTLNVLVCGAGSIGRRHIGNLTRLGATPMLWRARPDMIDAARAEFGIECGADRSEMMARADAVVVATAPDTHIEIARQAVSLGKPVFLEKPLSHNRDGVAALASEAETSNAVVEIGCQLRHHPALHVLARHLSERGDDRIFTFQFTVGQRLDQWRPGTDHRQGFSADAARGGGALFELVHEIDLATWFGGPVSEVQAMQDALGDLGVRGDDLTALTLRLANSAIGHVQMDMISPVYRRRLEVVTRDAIWRWDDGEGTVWRIDADGPEAIAKVPEGFQRNDLFLAHMRYFLSRIGDRSLPPSCSLMDGVHVLDVALAAREAARTGCQQRIA